MLSMGFLVADRTSRPVYMSATLLPEMLTSMSECVADVTPAVPWSPWFDSLTGARSAGEPVLEVGVHVSDVEPLMADLQAADAVADRLARRLPLGPGERLGYELVGYDPGGWHTWLCLGGLVEDTFAATGVRPGRDGLIESEPAARRAATWLTESGRGDPKVFLWIPALLTRP
ncbi:MAG: hypothetical protein GEV28_05770 [Actinophytocola sp.]|uniref:hypothetical protein n=1 Tax=Actinophytocola sp. TaxID=1872138 RepID=UPI0013229EB5|nr:hypothetical protein [Actinophytocola sp.]MPZ79920.1 hypothetical protein [Actinophytocola sp.]